MEVPARPVTGWAVVTATGDVDLASAPRLRERLVEAIEHFGPFVVVDLSGADFLDSSGLGVLAGLLRRVAAGNGEMRVVAGGAVRDLLGMTRLDRVFVVFESLADATSAPPAPRSQPSTRAGPGAVGD